METNGTYTILPIHWGSRNIWIGDWIALFTLGLAPLIAHVLSGAPRPSFLGESRPKWHDQICLFNPTSILWRYAAITDRRIHSRKWTPRVMAASNALFWTHNGWDGSESMIDCCIPYAAQWPDLPGAEIVSLEMLKNIIVFFQGIQAVAAVMGNFLSVGDYTTMDTVNGLFIPLATCGMLRLFAAPWLTDSFIFTSSNLNRMQSDSGLFVKYDGRMSVDSLLVQPNEGQMALKTSKIRQWGSRAFRVTFMLPILGFWALNFLYITPWIGTFGWKGIWTTTSWLLGLYYMTLLTSTALILAYYFFRGPLQTTIIPCIATKWYKVYCIFSAAFTLLLILVAAVETRKTVCGKYTSLASKYGDPCATGDVELFYVGSPSQEVFGLAQELHDNTQLVVVNFTGTCLGVPSAVDRWQNATLLL